MTPEAARTAAHHRSNAERPDYTLADAEEYACDDCILGNKGLCNDCGCCLPCCPCPPFVPEADEGLHPLATANEARHALGISRDYSLASELADYEAEAEAEAAKWDAEGRREMYETLELYG